MTLIINGCVTDRVPKIINEPEYIELKPGSQVTSMNDVSYTVEDGAYYSVKAQATVMKVQTANESKKKFLWFYLP